MDLDKIKALALTASKGPWRWELNHQNKSVSLTGGRPMFDKIVMDFTRWGMGHAAPRFNDAIASGEYNIMERVEKYGAKVPGREHHSNWFMDVAHPDAQWIAASCPATVLELIAEVERLRAEKKTLLKGCELAAYRLNELEDERTAPAAGTEKDAGRYRKLFEIDDFCRNPLWPVVDWMRGGEVTKEEIDAALDAVEAHTKAGKDG